MKYLLLTFLSITFLFFACSKKSNPSQTRADMLRTGKWKLSTATLTVKLPNGKDTNLNYLNFIPPCHLDDYVNFGQTVYGSVFSGPIKCTLNDPDSVQFQWAFNNNYNNIQLYRGFSIIYSVTETILPYYIDTMQQPPKDPYLVLDTIINTYDTAFYHYPNIVLDTFWNLHFKLDSIPAFDILDGAISNFSQSSFTLNFTQLSTYPDSTKHHTGVYMTDSAGVTVTRDFDPIIRPDTFYYKFTYSNF
jgi:hypothetical protein